MRISCNWLQEWLDFLITKDFVIAAFEQLGFEIEAVDGEVLDLAIPPNRGDCLSVRGLARELAAFKGNRDLLREPEGFNVDDGIKGEAHKLAIHSNCNVYYGEVLVLDRPVQELATPLFMLKRLQEVKVKDINFIVNLTNYVMFEVGQPMHAFDNKVLQGNIMVREAIAGENLELLNGNAIILNAQDLVIADEEKTLALAGIMGGVGSGIAVDTQEIFVESANFNAATVMLSMRRHLSAQVQTDSAIRFARGVDRRLASIALARFKYLLAQHAKFKVKEVFFAEDKALVELKRIRVEFSKVRMLLGVEISDLEIKRILYNLNLEYVEDEDGLEVIVPEARNDISIREDLVEEVGRIYGYDNILAQAPKLSMNFKAHAQAWVNKNRVSDVLRMLGYTEAINYSFIDQKLVQDIYDDSYVGLKLKNPITEEHNFMRPSLWPGLLQNVAYNQARQVSRVKVFEIGKVFAPTVIDEVINVAGVLYGNAEPEQWGIAKRNIDFFDIKGDLECLLHGQQLQFIDIDEHDHSLGMVWHAHSKFLMDGARSAILIDNICKGIFGVLDPKLALQFKVEMPLVLFALELVGLKEQRIMQPISRYPHIRRDLAIVVREDIIVGDIIAVIKQCGGNILKQVIVFDVYHGKSLPKGSKSIGLGLILNSNERTLVDADANILTEQVVIKLKEEFAAELRSVVL